MSHAHDNNIQQRSNQQGTNTRRQSGPTDIQPAAEDNKKRFPERRTTPKRLSKSMNSPDAGQRKM